MKYRCQALGENVVVEADSNKDAALKWAKHYTEGTRAVVTDVLVKKYRARKGTVVMTMYVPLSEKGRRCFRGQLLRYLHERGADEEIARSEIAKMDLDDIATSWPKCRERIVEAESKKAGC